MDNIGGTGTNSRENVNFSGASENMTPNTENVGDFVRNQEVGNLPGQTEVQNNATEQIPMPEQGQMMEAALPPLTVNLEEKKTEPDEAPAMDKLRSVEIARNAEQLPKDYEAAFASVVEQDKRDPYQLVKDVDKARWDLLKKAYGRGLGDGLNGGGAQ